jgi:hypothetical protein
MNPGAIKIFDNFIPMELIDKTILELSNYNWSPVWADKRYAGDHWMTCPLIEEFAKTPNFATFELAAIIESKMNCKIKNLMFYAMLPGGDIPPHRDMVGNVGLGGLRLHIPIVTNLGVNFVVAGKKVVMNPSELWALDTSYMHSVSNNGNENRIHLVMDVIVNDWVLDLLPAKNVSYYLHQWHLILLGLVRVFKYLTNKDLKIKDFVSVLKNALRLKFFKK